MCLPHRSHQQSSQPLIKCEQCLHGHELLHDEELSLHSAKNNIYFKSYFKLVHSTSIKVIYHMRFLYTILYS